MAREREVGRKEGCVERAREWEKTEKVDFAESGRGEDGASGESQRKVHRRVGGSESNAGQARCSVSDSEANHT